MRITPFVRSFLLSILAAGLAGPLLLAQQHLGGMGGQQPQAKNGGSATLTAVPASYNGPCPVNIHFQGTLHYSSPGNGMTNTAPGPQPGWQVTFAVYRSDGNRSGWMVSPINTVTPFTYDWQVTQSMQGWAYVGGELVISGKADRLGNFQNSPYAHFVVNCAPKAVQEQVPGLNATSLCLKPQLISLNPAQGKAGDVNRILGMTALPAQVFFAVGTQRIAATAVPPAVSGDFLRSAAYGRNQVYVYTPHLPSTSNAPLPTTVYLTNACGFSNGLPYLYQQAQVGQPNAPGRRTPHISSHRPGPPPPPRPAYSQFAGGQNTPGNTLPSWTGAIQGVPARFSFTLNTGGRLLGVWGAQARYLSGGRSVGFASLKPGMRVKVSGHLSQGKIMATEVDVLN